MCGSFVSSWHNPWPDSGKSRGCDSRDPTRNIAHGGRWIEGVRSEVKAPKALQKIKMRRLRTPPLGCLGAPSAQVLYLKTQNDALPRTLTQAIHPTFRETPPPPHSGEFREVIPHVMIAIAGNDCELDHLEQHFASSFVPSESFPQLRSRSAGPVSRLD